MRLIFDYPAPDGTPVRRTLTRPSAVLDVRSHRDVLPALQEVERAVRAGSWAAGFLSYEAAPAFDPVMQTRAPGRLPLLWFGLFAQPVVTARPRRPPGVQPPLDWRPTTTRAEYDAALQRVHAAILDGETYQTNYTTRLQAQLPHAFDADALYASMCTAQGRGYFSDLDLGEIRILSATPELFFARRGRALTTRPMKGTHRRGRWWAEDVACAAELAASPKQRAENLMIVDLLRNDLGRIARTGTVHVPELFAVERYRTVLQMTSTIAAELPVDCALADILRALFPCGSVTGAPKIRTMALIRQLEATPREVYCGAIGLVAPGGDCTFSVPIRTVLLDAGRGVAEYGVGSGITADSTAHDEYAELVTKAAILTTDWPEFAVIETLRLEHGELRRVGRHLTRLLRSCAYFDRPCPEAALRARLDALAALHPRGSYRVRIEVDAHGTVDVQLAALDAHCAPGARQRVAIVPRAVDSQDVFLYHKTTRRARYESARAVAPDCFDVILGNERAEATELTRGNLVAQLDGRLVTPPLASGLLAGCLRAELLERGVVCERVLPLDQLRRAERLWFVNSLRGMIEIELAAPAVGA